MNDMQQLRIAIVGNPNCGKTTLFNALTGLRYKVANYPGVTVEKKSGELEIDGANAEIIDLPGIYALSGSSEDERITTSFLTGQLANNRISDIVISVVDATNLERNLYLTTQLIDLGIPIIVALNMMDLAEKLGISIKREILSNQLGLPVVAISANKRAGLTELKHEIVKLTKSKATSARQLAWLEPDCEYKNTAEELGTKYRALYRNEYVTPDIIVGSALLSSQIKAPTSDLEYQVSQSVKELESQGLDPASFEATSRYKLVNAICKRALVYAEAARPALIQRIDAILTHRIIGVFIFIGLMALIFQAIFLWAKIPTELIDNLVSYIQDLVAVSMQAGPLRSLLVDGILAGVGSVLVFIPQIAILFIFLGVLEDSGYLSRAAFIMDRLMRQVGLQGRSFIPLLSSFACAIPGIMATRTIPSLADRMVTILVAPLMSCSARLPVYALLIAAFIPDQAVFGFISLQGLVLFFMYILGIVGAALIAWLLKVSVWRGKPALFIMEMPPIRLPDPLVVGREVYDRVMQFIKGAGTIILACSIVLWFLASYPSGDIKESYAGKIGTTIEPIIKPLGFNWEIGVGILGSFAAREVFITSLATVYNVQDADNDTHSIVAKLKQKQASGVFPLSTALSLMVFYVFACQCISTLAVCKRETNSLRWPIFMFVYMTVLAYCAALLTHNLAVQFLL